MINCDNHVDAIQSVHDVAIQDGNVHTDVAYCYTNNTCMQVASWHEYE